MRANTIRADERGQKGVVHWLNIELNERRESSIFGSEQTIIEHLIERKLECKEAFTELENGLECFQWQAYLSTLISTAAIWNPEATSKFREVKKELEKLNQSIDDKATQLAKELETRMELCNEYGFSTEDTYHVLDMIALASANNGRYNTWIHKRIQPLKGQFDLKYWPTMHEFVNAIAEDSRQATVIATDDITTEAISSRKTSIRDFLRALSEAILENSESSHAFIPDNFRLSGRSLSSLTNCALQLNEDKYIDESYIKTTRQSATGDFRV